MKFVLPSGVRRGHAGNQNRGWNAGNDAGESAAGGDSNDSGSERNTADGQRRGRLRDIHTAHDAGTAGRDIGDVPVRGHSNLRVRAGIQGDL